MTKRLQEGLRSLDYLRDAVTHSPSEEVQGGLERVVAKGWIDGKATLHVHGRLRPIGVELEPRDICGLFLRQRPKDRFSAEQNRGGVPADEVIYGVESRKTHLYVQGAVLVSVRQPGKGDEPIKVRVRCPIWLRGIDECPRRPVDLQTIEGTSLGSVWMTDFAVKVPLLPIDGKRVLAAWLARAFVADELTDNVIERASQIRHGISGDERYPEGVSFRDWWNRINPDPMSRRFEIYVDNTRLGLRCVNSSDLVAERCKVFVGAPDLGDGTRERSTHGG
jgi:hypothetical protein